MSDLDKLLDELMGDGFTLAVFMLQVSLELARQQPDPQGWAENFISALHSRIDGNEARGGSHGLPVHEIARQRIDQLGQELRMLLPPRPA